MSAPLADALRRLGLPLDETVDDGDLGEAYRRAARENHPDGAPDEERERRGESMREINAARDLVRLSLELLSERPYTELSDRDNGTPAPAWWEDAIFEDPSGLGVRWNPGAVRIPWRQRFEQARLALCIAVGDTVTVEGDGVLALGRVEAFDSSVRVSRRTAWGGLPVELRRIGVEVRFPDGTVSTVDAADVRAAGWHCPVCGRTSTLGEPRERPCPRCIRRSRIDYDRWSDLGRRWRRLHRKLRELDRVATRLRAPALARVPRDGRRARRRPQPRRVAEHDRGGDGRGARRGRGRHRGGRAAGVAHAHPGRRGAPPPRALAPCRRGQARAHRPRSHGRRCSTSSACASSSSIASARASSASCARATRRASGRAAAVRRSATPSARRPCASCARVEIELGAVAPDAIALLGGFDSWRQAPDKWLIEGGRLTPPRTARGPAR